MPKIITARACRRRYESPRVALLVTISHPLPFTSDLRLKCSAAALSAAAFDSNEAKQAGSLKPTPAAAVLNPCSAVDSSPTALTKRSPQDFAVAMPAQPASLNATYDATLKNRQQQKRKRGAAGIKASRRHHNESVDSNRHTKPIRNARNPQKTNNSNPL